MRRICVQHAGCLCVGVHDQAIAVHANGIRQHIEHRSIQIFRRAMRTGIAPRRRKFGLQRRDPQAQRGILLRNNVVAATMVQRQRARR
jgi:hypothetical protein